MKLDHRILIQTGSLILVFLFANGHYGTTYCFRDRFGISPKRGYVWKFPVIAVLQVCPQVRQSAEIS